MIIAILALRQGLTDVVKASITGSIIGNALLVLGLSLFAGGLKFPTQQFGAAAARVQATMLLLAAIALIAPAAYHHLGGPGALASEGRLSIDISFVLIATYAAGLLFQLRTHKRLFEGHGPEGAEVEDDHGEPWSVGRSLGVLVGATVVIAWIAEILVGSVEHAAQAFGMTRIFVGVVVVAIVGNAAEHSTAVLVALKNRMDLSLSIAIGSSIQIALFVAPALVFLSYFVAEKPLDLVFSPAEVLAVALSVMIVGEIARDGESNWLEGVQLLAVYAILAMLFYFLPAEGPAAAAHP
jgi:Ca2+:H+ antiporter